MKLGKILSLTGFIIMLVSISAGLISGTFFSEGKIILAPLWGKISMIDVYTGFIIFSAWVAFRESSIFKSVIWILLILTLGNLTTCLYLYLNFKKSKDDWIYFFLGNKKMV